MEANHEENKVWVESEIYTVKRGQSIRSTFNWAKRWGVDRGRVRRFFKLLESDEQIEQKTTNKTTILTICNYDKYQGDRPSNDHQTTIKRPTDEHKQESKESKEEGVTNKKAPKWAIIFRHWNPRIKYPPELQNEKFVEIWDTWCDYKAERFENGVEKIKYSGTVQGSHIRTINRYVNGDVDSFCLYIDYIMSNVWGWISGEVSELKPKPKWKTDYQEYLKLSKQVFNKLEQDKKFNETLIHLYPEIKVYKSLINVYESYWKTKKAWESNKKSSVDISDWRASIIQSMKFNKIEK